MDGLISWRRCSRGNCQCRNYRNDAAYRDYVRKWPIIDSRSTISILQVRAHRGTAFVVTHWYFPLEANLCTGYIGPFLQVVQRNSIAPQTRGACRDWISVTHVDIVGSNTQTHSTSDANRRRNSKHLLISDRKWNRYRVFERGDRTSMVEGRTVRWGPKRTPDASTLPCYFVHHHHEQ